MTQEEFDRIMSDFEATKTADECWIWTGSTDKGYGQINLNGKTKRVHRLAYARKHGECPTGLYVCHRCDVRECCNPDHLFGGTHADNMRDKVEKNRHQKKLTDEQRLAIMLDKRPRQVIADEYRIHIVTVGSVQTGIRSYAKFYNAHKHLLDGSKPQIGENSARSGTTRRGAVIAPDGTWYPSLSEAGRKINSHPSTITRWVIAGDRGWRYAEKEAA